MLRKGLVVAALLMLPTFASAQVRGPWEVTLAGSGFNGNKFNGFEAALNGSIGFFFNDNIEVSGRQSLIYSDLAGVSLTASSALAADFHLPLGDQNQFLPFIGANIGYVYGKNVRDTWEAAPEAGIKWFVSQDVFLQAMVQYQFFFKTSSGVSGGFNNGQWVYTLGVGFRF